VRWRRGMLVVATALLTLLVADMLWPIDFTKPWGEIARQLASDRTQLAVFASIWIVIIAKHVIDRLRRGLPPPVPLLQRWRRSRAANAVWRLAAAGWLDLPEPQDVSDLRPGIESLKKDLSALAAEREARIRPCGRPEPEPEERARYLAGFRIV